VEALDTRVPGAGCRFLAQAARILNETFLRVHEKKLTRVQAVMFLLADMATFVEVGCALARKAATAAETNEAAARRLELMGRLFAHETARLVHTHVLTILQGSGAFEPDEIQAFVDGNGLNQLNESYQGVIPVMDRVADIVFER
jgi:alkylation response protein AidB-like acyl-CoA dehydrogenase